MSAAAAAAAATEFEAVIGLEIHCQLSTDTKIFCPCRARLADGRSVADVEPNSNTCPVCAGHPGTLPVLNRKVVDYAIRAGLATNCRINRENVFARKNYFYPDLPKGYQISQFDLPICENGYVDIQTAQGPKRITVQRIHMEEDAGKNLHFEDYSLVNLNRAGVPLIEIVSAPDLRTPEEAGAYMRALHSIVTYLGICDGNMQEGNFRCDANVSIRPRGAKEFGTRTEIKNVNSFRFVEKAIEVEIARQITVVRGGGKIVQETRSYDPDRNVTGTLRSKEEAHDYRYFPDPDLIRVSIPEAWVEKVKRELPELPEQKRARYVAELGLSDYDAGVLTASKAMARWYEEALSAAEKSGLRRDQSAKPVANVVTGEVARRLNESGLEIDQVKLRPEHVAQAVKLSLENVVSSTGMKKIIQLAWETGAPVDQIVEKEGLKQVSDLSSLEPAVDQVLAANPGPVAEYKAGKEKLIGFFVGQVMKATGGKANPGMLQELIKKKLQS